MVSVISEWNQIVNAIQAGSSEMVVSNYKTLLM